MLRGLTTVTHFADDLGAAQAWYTELLGVEPYFAKEFQGKPAYIEYRIGDYQHELGLLDAKYAGPGRPLDAANTVTYWAVDDVEAALERLLALGATEHGKVTEQGPGFVTASVIDPFGNILGVMYNQHYLDTVAART